MVNVASREQTSYLFGYLFAYMFCRAHGNFSRHVFGQTDDKADTHPDFFDCRLWQVLFLSFFKNTAKATASLLDLGKMKFVKDPRYLYPDVEFRSNLMKRIKTTPRC
ncbi:MAG: hypothetical protein KKG76_04940 [Euryarchaeota archaeon]|nr:hypothetical protein [Euryarchaeota archaeon]